MVRRAVFIDRDGVINENVQRDGRAVAPTRLEDFRLLPGVGEAARRLKAAGFTLVVVTNQPDIATGRTPREVVDVMNDKVRRALPVDDIKMCPHVDADQCGCRKPKPGMLWEAAAEHGIDLTASYMIGDRATDIAAGRAVGCVTIFVDSADVAAPVQPESDMVARSLQEAARFILRREGMEGTMQAPSVSNLKIKVFADGADLASIRTLAASPGVKGFTTNPTLMRAAGVNDYKGFAHDVLAIIGGRPVSFEVFADDFATMEQQAREIASWGDNVYVKIPVTNTRGDFAGPLIATLSQAGVKLNVTAIMTLDQVKRVGEALSEKVPAVVSVFAGRIADTGRDPVPHMREALAILKPRPKAELLWASPRELLNIFQADEVGCHIITATPDVLKKLALVGKDLDVYSRETVSMFYKDAQAAGYEIPLAARRTAS
jgi:transaldolase